MDAEADIGQTVVLLAGEAERLSWTDPASAAQRLTQLAKFARATSISGPGTSLHSERFRSLADYADDLAVRVRSGRLSGIAGLERRARQLADAERVPKR